MKKIKKILSLGILASVLATSTLTYAKSTWSYIGAVYKDGAEAFHDGYALVTAKWNGYGKASTYQYIDTNGKIAFSINALSATNMHNGRAGYLNDNPRKWGMVTSSGKKIGSPAWDYMIVTDYGAYIALEISYDTYKVGFMDRDGKIIVSPKYEYVGNLSLVQLQDRNIQFLEVKDPDTGNIYGLKTDGSFLKGDWNDIQRFDTNSIVISKGEKYGRIDMNNNVITPAIWDDLYPYQDGFSIVDLGDKCGLLNPKGEIVVPVEHDKIVYLNEGKYALYYVGTDGKQYTAIKDINGTVLLDKLQGDYNFDYFENGIMQYKKLFSNDSMFINSKGKHITPQITGQKDSGSAAGIAWIQNSKGQYTFYTSQGVAFHTAAYKYVFPISLEMSNGFQPYFAVQASTGKWAIMDKNLQRKTPFIFDEMPHSVGPEIISVVKNKELGYLGKNFAEITPYYYKWRGSYKNAYVTNNGIIIPVTESGTNDFVERFIKVKYQ